MNRPSCTTYTKAHACIYFPETPSCSQCPLLGAELVTGRKYCRRSGEFLLHTEHQIGYECPLTFEEETK